MVWDLATGTALHTLTGHRDESGRWRSPATGPGGDQQRCQTAMVWDLASGTALHALTGHRDELRAVAVTGDGTRAAPAARMGRRSCGTWPAARRCTPSPATRAGSRRWRSPATGPGR